MSDLRVPAGFYRELLALRDLRNAVRVYHDRFMLDEIETAEVCCVEGQHDAAISVHDALEYAEAHVWHSQHDAAIESTGVKTK
jgi:hypothetical protein